MANGRGALLNCPPSLASGATLRLVPFALLACMLAVSAAFAGTPATLRVPADAVHAGQRVLLEWSGLPADAREVELELSLDGGRWIRISPEMDAGESRWTWTVPNLSAESARIRLRYGRDHEESVATTSGAFPITGSGSGAERQRDHAGEWWQALAHEAAPASPGFGANVPELAPLERTPSADVPTPPSLRGPALTALGPMLRASLATAPPTLQQRCARPGFVPLRN